MFFVGNGSILKIKKEVNVLKKEKRKHGIKKLLSGVLAAIVLMGAIIPASTVETFASTPKWEKAYNKVLKNPKLVDKYDDTSYLKFYFGEDYKFNRYYYYDLDKNGTPELFLYSTTMGLTEIFTYKKKLISLGYYDIARINKSKKEIIVQGHWHGAGGSGKDEWSVYSMSKNKKKIVMKYYLDILSGEVTVYNGEFKLLSKKRSYYDKIYNGHIKKATKIGKFKKKKIK